MWAFGNAVFLLVLCVVLYAVFLCLWVGVLFLIRARRKPLYALASVPAYAVLLAAYVAWAFRPATVFKQSFGFSPPPDVSSLRSSSWVLGDSGTVYLRFRSSPETVARITARGLLALGSDQGPDLVADDPPDWWRPPTRSVVYVGRMTRRGFASEEEYLLYDAGSGEVYYRFIGID